MKYKKMTRERREFIDSKISMIRDGYRNGSEIDYNKLAEDFRITVLETSKIVVPRMAQRESGNYIFLPRDMIFDRVRRYGKAHEFGHAILHTDGPARSTAVEEAEANYFAGSLEQKGNLPLYFIEALYGMLIHPVAAFRDILRLRTSTRLINQANQTNFSHK